MSSVFFCTYVTLLRNANVECLAISHLRVEFLESSPSFNEVNSKDKIVKAQDLREMQRISMNKMCNIINKIILLFSSGFSGVAELPIHNAVTTFNSINDVSNVLH